VTSGHGSAVRHGSNPAGPANLAPGTSATLFDFVFTGLLRDDVLTYAGGAPGLWCAVVQINMLVSPDANPIHAATLAPVGGGPIRSAGGVTIAVK